MTAYIEIINCKTGTTEKTIEKTMIEYSKWIARAAMRRYEIIETASGGGLWVTPTTNTERKQFLVYFG